MIRETELKEPLIDRKRSWRHTMQRPVAAVALAGAITFPLAACNESSAPERATVSTVELDETLTPEQQAAQIEAGLNANKAITDVPVAMDYTLESSPKQLGIKDAHAISNPMKLSDNTYGYVLANHETGEMDVRTIKYSGELTPTVSFDGSPVNPRTENVTISRVYSVGLLGGVDPTITPPPTYNFYTVGVNQIPGKKLNSLDSERAGDLVYQGK